MPTTLTESTYNEEVSLTNPTSGDVAQMRPGDFVNARYVGEGVRCIEAAGGEGCSGRVACYQAMQAPACTAASQLGSLNNKPPRGARGVVAAESRLTRNSAYTLVSNEATSAIMIDDKPGCIGYCDVSIASRDPITANTNGLSGPASTSTPSGNSMTAL